MYEKGQQCWNGPQRSTKVALTDQKSFQIFKILGNR